jgi:hypothetical protein
MFIRRAGWLAVAFVGLSMVSVAVPLLPAAAVTSHSPLVVRSDMRHAPATTTCTGPGDFGTQYLSSAWPGGFTGVPVHSNGSATYSSNCYNYVTTPSGKSVKSGMEWQCVELVNRLYLTRGWISTTWNGDGDQLYSTAPSVGLTNEEKQGSITYLAPGDVISFNGPIAGGHAAVVSKVSGSSITLVNQNTPSSSTLSTATFSNGNLVMNGWKGYTPIGVIHAPSWIQTQISLPSQGLLNEQAPVACASPTACLAAFNYQPDPGAESAQLLWGHGTSWSPVPVPEPSHTNSIDVFSVACASSQRCVAAVGFNRTSPYASETMLLSGSGATWTAHNLPVPGNGGAGSGILNSVTCAPGGKCLAVGDYIDRSGSTQGLLVWGYGSTWTPSEALPAPGTSVGPQLWSAACESAGTCVALGYVPGGNGEAVLVSREGSSWTSAAAPIPAGDDAADPPGQVVCAAAGSCLAAVYGAKSGGAPFVNWLESGYGQSWTRAKLPVPSNGKAGSAFPISVACATSSHCLAVGQYTASSGQTAPLLLTGHGTAWTPTEVPLPADATTGGNAGFGGTSGLDGAPASCAASGLCAVLGYYTTSSGIRDLLVWGYNPSWSTVALSPASAGSAYPDFGGMACTSSPATSACAITETPTAADGTMIWGPG